MGAHKFKGKVVVPNLNQGGADFKYTDVLVSNVEIKRLRATPKTLIPAPGAGKLLEFCSAVLHFDAGADSLTESTANLAIKYQGAAGVQVSQTIESTGFLDQTADTVTSGLPKVDPITLRAASENQPLVLHNLGAAEISGNVAGDAVLRVKVAYRVHSLV